MRQVEFSAELLGRHFTSKDYIERELNRLQQQANLFNSTVLVDNEGFIVSTSKNITKAEGIQIKDEAILHSINKVQPFITKPFLSPKGNYLLCISYPIFSPNKEYLGYLGGDDLP